MRDEPLDLDEIAGRVVLGYQDEEAGQELPRAIDDVALLMSEVEDLRRRIDEALAQPQYADATEDWMRTILGAAPYRRLRA